MFLLKSCCTWEYIVVTMHSPLGSRTIPINGLVSIQSEPPQRPSNSQPFQIWKIAFLKYDYLINSLWKIQKEENENNLDAFFSLFGFYESNDTKDMTRVTTLVPSSVTQKYWGEKKEILGMEAALKGGLFPCFSCISGLPSKTLSYSVNLDGMLPLKWKTVSGIPTCRYPR